VATWDDIRAVALTLPGAWENDWRGNPLFQVGRKGFVQTWDGRVLMKLDKNHQELLFEARPDVFSPMMAGALRWSWVEIDALDPNEIADLVLEAWACVVPKKVSRPFLLSPAKTGEREG
jgi:hypothetical protein